MFNDRLFSDSDDLRTWPWFLEMIEKLDRERHDSSIEIVVYATQYQQPTHNVWSMFTQLCRGGVADRTEYSLLLLITLNLALDGQIIGLFAAQ